MPAHPLSDAACAEALAAWNDAGRNVAAAARAVGVNRCTFQNRLRVALLRDAGLNNSGPGGIGPSPERDGGEEYLVKGVSTYFDADGNQRGQWVKTKVDDQRRLAAIEAAITERAERVTPLPPLPLAKPELLSSALCNLLTVTDYHIGMLAWRREGGSDWDTPIARQTFRRCFGGLLSQMPEAHTCVINQLGDLLHTDGMVPVTPVHHHVLDADSRYQKMASIAADLMEELVLAALERHARVHVVMAEGNHDESGSAWLRIMFRRIFRDEPRVTIDDSPLPFYAYQHGETMLGFHHGHKVNNAQLPALFAGSPRFRSMWGAATRTYIHTGHRHHHESKEHSGCIVEQHPTLAAPDAHAARGGYISDRRAFGITYHASLGEVGRVAVTPDMFGV